MATIAELNAQGIEAAYDLGMRHGDYEKAKSELYELKKELPSFPTALVLEGVAAAEINLKKATYAYGKARANYTMTIQQIKDAEEIAQAKRN